MPEFPATQSSRHALLALSFHLGTALCLAAALPPVELPRGGRDLVAVAGEGEPSPVLPGKGGVATARRVISAEAPWSSYWHVEITMVPDHPWNVQLGATLAGSISKGDKCVLLFYVRGIGGTATGAAHVEARHPPDYPKLGSTAFRAGEEWQPVIMPFEAAQDAPAGSSGVAIHLGESVQRLDIGGIRLLDYGPDFPKEKLPYPYVGYEGREPDAPWRNEAYARIEKLRKGDFALSVADPSGTPLANADVHASLKRHEFGFGSAVTAQWLNDTSPDGQRYRAIVEECFSRVVLENDMKTFAWDAMKDPAATGRYRREWLDKALAWLADRHISVRGHYLCWAPFEPWSEKLKDKPDAIRAKIFEHMREIAPAMEGKVAEWDAVNHPAGWEKDICIDTVLGRNFYTEVFKEARRLTKAPLWINEDQVFRPGRQQEEYYEIIKKLVEDGAAPDGIGNQAHFHSSFLPSPEQMLENSDRFAALVPALELTEFDVTTNGDEKLAADFTRDVLISTFSHPAYTGVVMWGFWEAAHWKPEAALWRKDWSEKPAAKVWRELVGGKWRTDATLKTDAHGRANLRGFYGQYDFEIRANGIVRRVSAVLAKGSSQVVELRLPAGS